MAGKTTAKSERYLNVAFDLFQKTERLAVTKKNNRFNDTEMRLLGVILGEKRKGRKLISTQLADRLGITRSAISQIVNRLEGQGVVKRVADDVDRKIAYIEVTDETLTAYAKILRQCRSLIGDVVEEFGAERFDTMCVEVEEFLSIFEKHKKQSAEEKE